MNEEIKKLNLRIAYLKKAIEVSPDNETLATLDDELKNAEDELLVLEMDDAFFGKNQESKDV